MAGAETNAALSATRDYCALSTSASIRVMIVDDHPIVCEGIAAMVGNEPGMEVVAQAADGVEAVQKFRTHRPDVTLMDLQMPRMNGLEAVSAIRHEFQDARIIVLTTYCGDVNATRAVAAGAAGYFLKNMVRKDLLQNIRRVHEGMHLIQGEVSADIARHQIHDMISPREVEVLHLVAQGYTNRAVAAHMGIKEETVKTHMRTITAKLGVDDRTHAVTIGLRRGIITL